ncbi:uncharacterized protein LOC132558306 [Ylistrum balloti]|uniref:uncharacterized protein LOC132558306 n=1 Tax=Ylistrum balloti TaxID=509963 RepID=UPI002905DE40|nr:uncharacterized protein LOC132558306 [Ylistrum balloti]
MLEEDINTEQIDEVAISNSELNDEAYQSGLEGSPRRRKSFLPGPKTFGGVPAPSTKVAGLSDHQGTISHYQPVDTHQELYVGQRVYIGGIKQGTVLYYGRTHLADGIFCGVELDEPEGKHDGQVQGVRYFRCRPGHGIFAPVEKVTKVGDRRADEAYESDYQQALASQQRLSRRLLPQPKTYARTGSRERIAIPSCIEEQNEDITDTVDETELRYLEEQLRARNSPKLVGDNQCWDLNAKKSLSDTYTKEDFTNVKSSPKRSRLPAYSKVAPSRSEEYNYTEVAADIELICKEEKSTQRRQDVKDFSKTYTLSDNLPDVVDHHRPLTESSSGDDSLSTDAKECLCSDRRQYFNLTFDTGSNNSSPQHLPKDTGVLEAVSAKDATQPRNNLDSSNSSLGLVDVNGADFSTDLLGIDGNLTDSEKLKHTFSVSKRTDRVASLSDTFSLDHAVTSTPEKLLSQQDLIAKHAEQESLSHGSRKSLSKRSLAATFEIEHKDLLPVNTGDTLDWRQEASDGENDDRESYGSENQVEQEENVRQVNIEIQNVKNSTFSISTLDQDGKEALIPNVGITGEELIKSGGPVEVEQLLSQRSKRPMTDSGIGLTDSCEMRRSQNMADSGEFRRSQNLESVLEDVDHISSLANIRGVGSVSGGHDLQDGHSNDSLLRADLEAGHLKQGRPLSLISTTSADTGYVPDTDTDIELEVGTAGSPVHWEEQKSHSSASELDKAYANTFKHYQAGVTRTVRSQGIDSDSDLYSDAGTIVPEDDTLKSTGILELYVSC